MRITLKFVFWVFGLLLSGIPLIMSIAKTPGDLPDAFTVSSYNGNEAEILFIGLMMAAVTLTETIELLIDLEDTEKVRKAICGAFSLVFVVMVVLYSYWYGVIVEREHANMDLAHNELRAVVLFVAGTVAPALIFKFVLWSRKSL